MTRRTRAVCLIVGAALMGGTMSVIGASLSIDKAAWSREDDRLSVSGKAARRATVTVRNADSGAAIGTVQASREGEWRLRLSLSTPPCRVRAEASGASAERAVARAPSNCDRGTGGPTLSGLSISGPSAVNESASASFAATASLSDGTVQTVTAAATWTENSSFATISGGTLRTSAVTGNQTVTITAAYTSGGVTRTATRQVTILDATAPAVTLAGLSISGPSAVGESGSATYAAIASFSDGSTQTVTASATWSENSVYATIHAGVLTTTGVNGDQPVMIAASYASGGVTRLATLQATIQDAPAVSGSHAGRFSTYEGTKTCLACHTSQANAFHQSVHYQWKGDASQAEGLSTAQAGKLGGINDFCIYPDINWLGKLTNVDGLQVDGGCARCHTGRGAKPTPEATPAQLENIDCLLCHSPSYKRTVSLASGQAQLVPDTAKMSVSLLQAAVDIRRPTSDTCLNCHTKAGGGNNFKRGDIEEAHRNASTGLDVHMAPRSQGGAGLSCTGCHVTAGHRIPGRGVDMRQRDTASPVACTNCHSPQPHGDSNLNRHTARLACNTCHVPSFAKTAPTDMRRDWSLPGDVSPETRLFEPHMDLRTNVTPVYRFFNGRSRFYEFGTPATPEANGRVLMAGPLGAVTEAGSKITAMKRHEGRQPIDPVTRYLLPLKIGVFFQTGDIDGAIRQGIAAMGWTDNGYAFAETERYMGLYHEVAPKAQALTCNSCHGGTRLDFAALGYTPLQTRNGKPLCSSCHSPKTGSFEKVHDKHVRDKRIDCSTCHTFSKAL